MRSGLPGEAEPEARLAAALPANVRAVCETLARAGYQAVAVGGAVRDALIGRPAGDWDVATSARPDEVMALFRHTVPTGLAHGTITVVTGKGKDSHVEVTTFRGEGAYSDARRSDHVVFGVPLDHTGELDLESAREVEVVLLLHDVRDAALARLRVDADHRLIVAPEILRVDRQVWHRPLAAVGLLHRREALLDRVLVRA